MGSIFLLLLSISLSLGAETTLECIDNFIDFQTNKWTAYPLDGYFYVGTSSEIPSTDLQGKLDGNGIFYFPGIEQGSYGYYFKESESYEDIRPMYMYIKYYSHARNSNLSYAFGMPSTKPDSGVAEYFDPSANLTWNEYLFQVDVNVLKASYLNTLDLKTSGFKPNDYFLFDQIIVSQGVEIEGIDHMKILCGWNDDTTTTQTSTVPTTQPPSSEFECEEAGSFADPEDCTKFHVCQDNGAGGFTDDVLTCPVNTVWCQKVLVCETEKICPCSI